MWPKANFEQSFQISFSKILKRIAECDSTGRELSFEWSHHRISSTDSKVRVTLQNSIKHSGSERVKGGTRVYCCSRSIPFRSSQLLFKLTQSINTIERFEYNKKDCEEVKEFIVQSLGYLNSSYN